MNERLDQWTCVYDAPTATPFELKPVGSVFRGFMSFRMAHDYMGTVNAFFSKRGVPQSAQVVHGPTSTTHCTFEVVAATCGYRRAAP